MAMMYLVVGEGWSCAGPTDAGVSLRVQLHECSRCPRWGHACGQWGSVSAHEEVKSQGWRQTREQMTVAECGFPCHQEGGLRSSVEGRTGLLGVGFAGAPCRDWKKRAGRFRSTRNTFAISCGPPTAPSGEVAGGRRSLPSAVRKLGPRGVRRLVQEPTATSAAELGLGATALDPRPSVVSAPACGSHASPPGAAGQGALSSGLCTS